jgi:hypothetical protein
MEKALPRKGPPAKGLAEIVDIVIDLRFTVPKATNKRNVKGTP